MSDSDTVVSVENLSKRYLVGHEGPQERYHSLRDTIVRHGKNFLRKTVDMAKGNQIIQGDTVEEFWALKDVSFEVKRGEVLGIIGRNGAGKSTLLKILSRITEPTSGRVTLRGRVASLLEVGTGFHPELTGRENIFLNGAILGMSRAEIKSKFDEIVDFAGVEKFLDTPVKRYSSGMYVRLAFAVAAHLEPEILIIDEVLAVGDLEFQKKCLGKMQDVAKGGRTVIFVSHNIRAMQQLCNSGMVLRTGNMIFNGGIEDAISEYLGKDVSMDKVNFEACKDAPVISSVAIDNDALRNGDLLLTIEFQSPFELSPPVVGIMVASDIGVPVYGSNPRFHKDGYNQKPLSVGTIEVKISKPPIAPGRYSISFWLGDWHVDFDRKLDALIFDFVPERELTTRPSSAAIGHLDWPAFWKII